MWDKHIHNTSQFHKFEQCPGSFLQYFIFFYKVKCPLVGHLRKRNSEILHQKKKINVFNVIFVRQAKSSISL